MIAMTTSTSTGGPGGTKPKPLRSQARRSHGWRLSGWRCHARPARLLLHLMMTRSTGRLLVAPRPWTPPRGSATRIAPSGGGPSAQWGALACGFAERRTVGPAQARQPRWVCREGWQGPLLVTGELVVMVLVLVVGLPLLRSASALGWRGGAGGTEHQLQGARALPTTVSRARAEPKQGVALRGATDGPSRMRSPPRGSTPVTRCRSRRLPPGAAACRRRGFKPRPQS